MNHFRSANSRNNGQRCMYFVITAVMAMSEAYRVR